MSCTHTTELHKWIPTYEDDYDTYIDSHWETTTVFTTKDTSIGAYICTQCNQTMYYTGSWRKFYEEGVPCPGSELASKYYN